MIDIQDGTGMPCSIKPDDFVVEFDSKGATEAVKSILKNEGVDSTLDPIGHTAGIHTQFRLIVGESMAHRARWILTESGFTDAELTFLATGELGPEE